MARIIAPALRALLGDLIDYAGMFPPASLAREVALSEYNHYRAGEHCWMLGRFVISAEELEDVPATLGCAFAVLSDQDHPRASAIETKTVIATAKPTYCEVPVERFYEVKRAGSFAKIRTGGITPDAIPAVASVAKAIKACTDQRLPFKATAGLHHPIRGEHRLTYEQDAPAAMMHGFINVFIAAAFAWRGDQYIEDVLAETDPSAFRFDDHHTQWRDRSLSVEEIARAREDFAHSFGSCSFEEPIADLRSLGWL